MIGLSLSQCISDVCRGVVAEKDVEMIVTGTDAPTLYGYLEVVREYAKTSWHDFQLKALGVAIRLWRDDKIDQPRTRGEGPYFTGDGPWVDENQNTFRINGAGGREYSGHKLARW